MKVPKWLRRDRNGRRRNSESQATSLNSPVYDTNSINEYNLSRNDQHDETNPQLFKDRIITEEYTKAYSDFVNRRSLGPNVTLNSDKSKLQVTPESSDKSSYIKNRKKPVSDHKPKRCSLPNSTEIASKVPQIKFLFSGQIFMPGSGMGFQNKKTQPELQDDTYDVNNSCYLSTSPDLLPPRFLRAGKQIDFDDCDTPSSPPNDFFKDNSLPYIDDSMKSNNMTLDDDEPIDSIEGKKSDASETSELNTTSDSCSSVVRKLEQICDISHKSGTFRYFRCVPLIKSSDIQYDDENDLLNKDNKYWHHGSWMCVPILIKKNMKTWCPHEIIAPLDDFIGKDLEILTKFRHPNFWLLLGLCYDDSTYIQSFFEESLGTLHDCIHEQGTILSCQTSLRYLSGIASALLYLKANNYIHSAVSSHTVMITSRDVAKLYNFELACRIKMENSAAYDPYKLHYSSDPEYENLKDFSTTKIECEPQDVKLRSLFAPFRWQAPEQFDDTAGLVYACKKTDVYSLCLVLWECLNHSPPWKTLSYDQLSELYFSYNTGIRLAKDGSYPQPIFDILSNGLAIKSHQRQEMSIISEKFKDAIAYLNSTDDIYFRNNNSKNNIGNEKSRSENLHSKEKMNGLFNMKLKDIKKYEVTDLDEDVKSVKTTPNQHFYPEYFVTQRKSSYVNISSLPAMSSTEHLSECDVNFKEPDLHNSNSTEYCSIATPEFKKIQSKTLTLSPKRDADVATLQTKYNTPTKLNDIITPKSYKSLEIESPTMERINNILSLTKSIDSEPKTRRSKCVFDVENENMPETPIARNTKIRRNAWLSGEDEDTCNDKTDAVEKLYSNKSNPNEQKKNNQNINNNIVNRGRRRHSLINIKYDTLASADTVFTSKSSLRKSPSCSDEIIPNFGLFRARSRSWSIKSNKTQDDITGVDIKPLVAIHEKWIMDAQKQHHRFVSLPDNFGSSSGAVKPASHLTDSIRSRRYSEFEMPKNIKSVTSAPTITRRSENFFENTLWHKEKNRCTMSTENFMQNSTPNKESFEPIQNLINKFTTDTYTKKTNDPYKTVTKFKSLRKPLMSDTTVDLTDDPTFKSAKSSILAELASSFEQKFNTLELNKSSENNRNYDTIIIHSDDICDSVRNLQPFDEIINKNVHNESNGNILDGDDSVSLPDNLPQHNTNTEELTNKALKRCQAFSALQDARSTEDMYIDDELNAQTDIQNLGSNIQLQSIIHEQECDKGNDCCLLGIKKDLKCDNIVLYCESFESTSNKKNISPCDFEDDDLYLANNIHNNLIDLDTIKTLPVIEERSEEDTSEHDMTAEDEEITEPANHGVQDLISLYESVTIDDNAKNDAAEYEEINFIILDNNDIRDKEYCRSEMSDSIIEDIIQV